MHEAEVKIKGETVSDWAVAHKVIWLCHRYSDGVENWESNLIHLATHFLHQVRMYLLSAYWSRPCPRLPISIWDMTLGVDWVMMNLLQSTLYRESWMGEQSSGAAPLGYKGVLGSRRLQPTPVGGEDHQKRPSPCDLFLLPVFPVVSAVSILWSRTEAQKDAWDVVLICLVSYFGVKTSQWLINNF